MCDRAGRIRHDLFSIFPVSILISWGQTPAVRTESPVRSGQGAIVPLAAHYPVEVFPSKAALGGYHLVRQICKEVFMACANTHGRLKEVACPLLGAGFQPPNTSMIIPPYFPKSSDHTSVF